MAAMDVGGGGRRQRQTTKAVDDKEVDDDGTQDWAANYKGEGGEWAAKNNGIRQKADKPARQRVRKIKKSSLRKKTFFSNTVCPFGFFAFAKTANVLVLLYQSYMKGRGWWEVCWYVTKTPAYLYAGKK